MKTVSRYYVYCDLVTINSLSFTMQVAVVGKNLTSLFMKFWRDNLLRSCPNASVDKAEFTGLSLERGCNKVFEIRPEGWFFFNTTRYFWSSAVCSYLLTRAVECSKDFVAGECPLSHRRLALPRGWWWQTPWKQENATFEEDDEECNVLSCFYELCLY